MVIRASDVCSAYYAGYNETVFRRRRLYPHINDVNFHLRSYAERQAVNFCVQGVKS